MSDDGKLHYEAWCEADVRGYGPPWESIPPLLRALHDRVAALFIKRVGAERDAAIAERDRLRAQVADLLPEAEASQHFATRALRAEDRLDRLRRELEELRDSLRTNLAWGHSEDVDAFWHELDAILRGES